MSETRPMVHEDGYEVFTAHAERLSQSVAFSLGIDILTVPIYIVMFSDQEDSWMAVLGTDSTPATFFQIKHVFATNTSTVEVFSKEDTHTFEDANIPVEQ